MADRFASTDGGTGGCEPWKHDNGDREFNRTNERSRRAMNLRSVKKQDTAILRFAAANDAVTSLRYALAAAKQAGAKRTADKIRCAIRSAQGAVRHAGGMVIRAKDL